MVEEEEDLTDPLQIQKQLTMLTLQVWEAKKKHDRERKENERESLITKKINNSFAITESPSWACSNEINAIWQIVCSCQRAYVIVVSTINQ